MSTRFNRKELKHVAHDATSINDKRPVVSNGDNRRDEKRSGDSLACLDLFHNLPISEQGWGREVVDYE